MQPFAEAVIANEATESHDTTLLIRSVNYPNFRVTDYCYEEMRNKYPSTSAHFRIMLCCEDQLFYLCLCIAASGM